MEVKSSNQALTKKVSELEQRVCELQDDTCTPVPKKKRRLSPTRDVRVSLILTCRETNILLTHPPLLTFTGCRSKGVPVLVRK